MLSKTVFISYSHKDKRWKDRFVTHLGVLEQQGLLRTWSDDKIRPGELWLEAIRNEIDNAIVVILLVSAYSLTSEFILREEVPRFLEKQKEMSIFPVIVTDCAWRSVPWLAKLQVRPEDGQPLELKGKRTNVELRVIAETILRIVESGSSTRQDSHKTDPTQTPLPALHQIPSPPLDFVGRQEDLSALKTSLTHSRVGAIFGMGGVGKSALAFKLAEELGFLYPDAQLYVDLQGMAPQPLTATQAMEGVVRSFHPDKRLPEGKDEMERSYRSVLHEKRVLLLMDSARNREQVEPLIPPPGSLLLVTSRFRFTLPGLVARDLDELPQKDACNLLLRIAPRIRSSVEEISDLCGHLPLALRLAGSTLAERPELSPADFIRRLKAGKELDPVAANLRLSYELLSEYHRRLWRLLAVFPGTFDASAAAAIWNLEADLATDSLGDLARSSLVERDDKDGRYRLHDLARSLADSLLENDEREDARRRHSEHYLEVLRMADDLAEEGESLLQGLSVFDTEWGNIQTGQAWAARHFSEDDEIAGTCSDYPNAGTVLLGLRQHPQERIRWRELAFSAARQRKDRKMEGYHLGNLGLAYADLGEIPKAVGLYEQWAAIAREIDDLHGQGQALGNLGLAYAELGEPRRAIEFHEQSLAIARGNSDWRSESAVLGNLGTAYKDLGNPRRAIEFHEQSLAVARKNSGRRSEAAALNNLGLAYRELGEPRRAFELHEQALAIARDIGDRLGESNALGNLGLAYEKLAEPSRAIELYVQQRNTAREIGDRRGEGNALGNLSFAYAIQEPRRAIELAEQQLDIARKIGDGRNEGEALGNLAIIYGRLGESDHAMDLYKQRLAIARERDDRRGEANASWNLGLVFEKEGDLRRASDLMQRRVDYLREIGHPDADQAAASVSALRARIAAESS